MYLETFKVTDEVKWVISHDKSNDHKFTIRGKINDFTQMTLALTEKEAKALVEQLGFAIQDYEKVSIETEQPKMCQHWSEEDDEGGRSYEFCRASSSQCSCSGVNTQCNKGLFKEVEHE